MPVIDMAIARHHLREPEDDEAYLLGLLEAAEQSAADYLQRQFFADTEGLSTARMLVPAARAAAREAYDAARAQANSVADGENRQAALADAERVRRETLDQCEAIAQGMVINPAIQAACLLTLGHLYANREDVVVGTITAEMPKGATALLTPYRVGWGV